MKADLLKRLFKGIYAEDIVSLKKIATAIIDEEKQIGHGNLADYLEHISVTEKPRISHFGVKTLNENAMSELPTSKRDNSQLISTTPHELLKHHMVLPEDIEKRLQSIEKEFSAQERLKKYN
ncbi:MAG: hypothetical protein LBO66_06185 [Deltaproteobacteria bacterium]|jgi:hypothetical protein|nr:hypothetical protein [Deltaproteobacteria bacterium]